MYQRILLAYDGSLEGRVALREGALLARLCGADVFLLAVVFNGPGVQMAEGAYAGALANMLELHKTVLDGGVARLKRLGLKPVARLVVGEPAKEISAFALEVAADLVVVGHRRRSMLQRWWSGSDGAHLADHLACSLLIARNSVADPDLDADPRDPDAVRPDT